MPTPLDCLLAQQSGLKARLAAATPVSLPNKEHGAALKNLETTAQERWLKGFQAKPPSQIQ